MIRAMAQTSASEAARVTSSEEAHAPPRTVSTPDLPQGVELRELRSHADDRGAFTELFRAEWRLTVAPVQWNAVRSAAGVLRGVHVHRRHEDYLTVIAGRASIGLADLRGTGDVAETATVVELDSLRPRVITIPTGVAHGFLFHEPSVHVYAVSEYWDPADELGCRWDDPDLAIPWPAEPTSVSSRDRELPSLAELRAQLAGPA
jgi:dTDP-4-dehydrorhamnose 3,5-epimerase